jgi:hypothetical protein
LAASKVSDSRVAQSKPDDPPATKKKRVEKSPPKKSPAKAPAKKKGRKGAKTSRDAIRISKEEEAQRKEHQQWLDSMKEEAKKEILKVKMSVSAASGDSFATCPFPDDPVEDFISCSQCTPIKLSDEEKELGSQDFNHYQMVIYSYVADRLKKKPRKYLSPFKINSSRPKVPLAKALALRNKIDSSAEFKE